MSTKWHLVQTELTKEKQTEFLPSQGAESSRHHDSPQLGNLSYGYYFNFFHRLWQEGNTLLLQYDLEIFVRDNFFWILPMTMTHTATQQHDYVNETILRSNPMSKKIGKIEKKFTSGRILCLLPMTGGALVFRLCMALPAPPTALACPPAATWWCGDGWCWCCAWGWCWCAGDGNPWVVYADGGKPPLALPAVAAPTLELDATRMGCWCDIPPATGITHVSAVSIPPPYGNSE